MRRRIAAECVKPLEKVQISFAFWARQQSCRGAIGTKYRNEKLGAVDLSGNSKPIDHPRLENGPCLSDCGIQLPRFYEWHEPGVEVLVKDRLTGIPFVKLFEDSWYVAAHNVNWILHA